MEARVSVLETKVDALEERADKHDQEDESIHKYMTNMMENLQARLAGIERTGARFEADLTHRTLEGNGMAKQLEALLDRVRTVERLIWIAMGAVGAVGSIATFFGWNILKALGK